MSKPYSKGSSFLGFMVQERLGSLPRFEKCRSCIVKVPRLCLNRIVRILILGVYGPGKARLFGFVKCRNCIVKVPRLCLNRIVKDPHFWGFGPGKARLLGL